MLLVNITGTNHELNFQTLSPRLRTDRLTSDSRVQLAKKFLEPAFGLDLILFWMISLIKWAGVQPQYDFSIVVPAPSHWHEPLFRLVKL